MKAATRQSDTSTSHPTEQQTTPTTTRNPKSPTTERPQLLAAYKVDADFHFQKVTLSIGSERLHGHGVFSNVYAAHLLKPTDIPKVAIKKSWPTGSEVDIKHDKEVQLIYNMDHPNIVRLLYVFDTPSTPSICRSKVFEFMDTTVSGYVKKHLKEKRRLHPTKVKIITYQLLSGLAYLHDKMNICHRDIKPQNMLINQDTGLMQIADFGNAKKLRANHRSTPYQVTRFYRAPELCLESEQYGFQIDTWAAACVIAELFELGQVLFPGKSNRDQFIKIEKVLGSPSPAEVVAMKCKKPPIRKTPIIGVGLRDRVRSATPLGRRLMASLLKYDPAARTKPHDACYDQFFDDLRRADAKMPNGRPLPVAIVKGNKSNDGSRSRRSTMSATPSAE